MLGIVLKCNSFEGNKPKTFLLKGVRSTTVQQPSPSLLKLNLGQFKKITLQKGWATNFFFGSSWKIQDQENLIVGVFFVSDGSFLFFYWVRKNALLLFCRLIKTTTLTTTTTVTTTTTKTTSMTARPSVLLSPLSLSSGSSTLPSLKAEPLFYYFKRNKGIFFCCSGKTDSSLDSRQFLL